MRVQVQKLCLWERFLITKKRITNIGMVAINTINKENKRLGVISARIKRLDTGNGRLLGESVTGAKVLGDPVSNNNSKAHAHRPDS